MQSMERRVIPSHPSYSADNRGNIYGKKGKRIKTFPGTGGYLRFTTFEKGKWQQVSVHVMVCEAFHGKRRSGMQAAHANGVKTDNRPENLSWKTGKENEADKRRHGLALLGERHHQHKLTDEQVIAIRNSDEPGVALADKYGVSSATISSIRLRQTWRHL